MGTIYHTERRLPTAHTVTECVTDGVVTNHEWVVCGFEVNAESEEDRQE